MEYTNPRPTRLNVLTTEQGVVKVDHEQVVALDGNDPPVKRAVAAGLLVKAEEYFMVEEEPEPEPEEPAEEDAPEEE